MKNKNKIWLGRFALAIIAMAAFAFTACGEPNGGGGNNGGGTTRTVTFDAGAGSVRCPNGMWWNTVSETVLYGERVTEPQVEPMKLGYYFLYWYDAATNTEWNFNTPVTANLTLRARWALEGTTSIVTFVAVDGHGWWLQRRVITGGTVTRPEDPIREGFYFMHWAQRLYVCEEEWWLGWDTADYAFDFNTQILQNTTLEAQWAPGHFTVTFDSGGGDNLTERVLGGSRVTRPATGGAVYTPTAAGLYVGSLPLRSIVSNWYLGGTAFDFNTPIVADITLTAGSQLSPRVTSVAANDVAAAVTHVNAASSGLEYTLVINSNVYAAPQTLNRWNSTLTIAGIGGQQEIRLSSNGNLFILNRTFLILEENITLVGRSISGNGNENNDRSLILVGWDGGGTLTMNAGSRITGNGRVGVEVSHSGGTFNMMGGEIVDNSSGVSVASGGTFNMMGGVISGNASGGVGVSSGGTFNMMGGVISGNASLGVSVGGTFNMMGGVISGNTPGQWDFRSGVFVGVGGMFNISNGIIHGRRAAEELRNTGMILYGAGLQRGTFNAEGEFTPLGNLRSTVDTIHVINGVLQRESGIAGHLAWLFHEAQDGGSYTIEINADEDVAPITELPGRSDVTITLRGIGAQRNIRLSANGHLFDVSNNVTLVLDNITLVGRRVGGNGNQNNTTTLVNVGNGGTLVMNTGSGITDNHGGGVNVASGGTLVMNTGSRITDNHGGGVNVASGGTLVMNTGSKITGNHGGGGWPGGAGAVSVSGTFNMNGGEISGNIGGNGNNGPNGIAQYIWGSPGGTGGAGAVSVSGTGTFNMTGGAISGNSGGHGGNGGFNHNSSVRAARGAGGTGGIFNSGTTRISNGLIHGSNEAVVIRNTAGYAGGLGTGNPVAFATLGGTGTRQRGTYTDGVWGSLVNLANTNDTIHVVNGELQP